MSKKSEMRKARAWDKAQEDLFSRYGDEDAAGNGFLNCSAWDAVHVVVSAYQEILREVK